MRSPRHAPQLCTPSNCLPLLRPPPCFAAQVVRNKSTKTGGSDTDDTFEAVGLSGDGRTLALGDEDTNKVLLYSLPKPARLLGRPYGVG